MCLQICNVSKNNSSKQCFLKVAIHASHLQLSRRLIPSIWAKINMIVSTEFLINITLNLTLCLSAH